MASNSDTDNIKAGCADVAVRIRQLLVEVAASPGAVLSADQTIVLVTRLEDYATRLEAMAGSPLAVAPAAEATTPLNL